ncbi:MAG: hypothetical protein J5482_05320 [Oscillospiraceae bacterium]|nr:hypothetical protein [Oscillospiraceae bacterium]
MSDLYDKVRRKPTEKRHVPSIPLLVTGAVLTLALIVGLIIVRPLYRHREFMRFLSDLSESTVYATVHNSLRCERDGQPPLRITVENAYAIYNKIAASGEGDLRRDVPDEGGILLRYGNGAMLELWQYTYTSGGRREGVLIRYTNPTGGQYIYCTNRSFYSNMSAVLTPKDNPLWEDAS